MNVRLHGFHNSKNIKRCVLLFSKHKAISISQYVKFNTYFLLQLKSSKKILQYIKCLMFKKNKATMILQYRKCHTLHFMFYTHKATKILQGLIPDKEEKDHVQMTNQHYEHLYIFTILWSIGAFLELDDRAKLEEFLRNNTEFSLDLPRAEDADSVVFDYFVDKNGKYPCSTC